MRRVKKNWEALNQKFSVLSNVQACSLKISFSVYINFQSIYFTVNYDHMYVPVCKYSRVWVCVGTCTGKKKASDPPELELKGIVS